MDRPHEKNLSTCSQSPEIVYPCLWVYKVIGKNQDDMREAIMAACTPHPVKISSSRASSKGSYWSFNAEIEVKDEPMRLSLYQSLSNHPAITLVL
jgi:putative lipoic acid-binding regulatory protein